MAWSDILEHEFAKRIMLSHLKACTLPNAYLLVGLHGIGKRRLALELAKAINCQRDNIVPCDSCETCAQINKGLHPDIHVLAPGGASNEIRIDQTRHIISRLALKPFNARMQIVIVDGAERLSEEAANSLLKILEEPPKHSRFVLVTSKLNRCISTIVSRCQVIRCQPLSADSVVQIVIGALGCDLKMAKTLARFSKGSASEAIDLAKRWQKQQAIIAVIQAADLASFLRQPLSDEREDVASLIDCMVIWLRDIAVVASAASGSILHSEQTQLLRDQAGGLDVDRCIETVFGLVDLRESLEQFVSPRLVAALARERWLNLFETTGHSSIQ